MVYKSFFTVTFIFEQHIPIFFWKIQKHIFCSFYVICFKNCIMKNTRHNFFNVAFIHKNVSNLQPGPGNILSLMQKPFFEVQKNQSYVSQKDFPSLGLYHSARITDLYQFFLVKERPCFIEYKEVLRRALQQNHVSFFCFQKVLKRPMTYFFKTNSKIIFKFLNAILFISSFAIQQKNSSRIHFDEKQFFFFMIYLGYLGFWQQYKQAKKFF